MLVDDGLLERVDGSWTVTGDLSRITIPPTIHALLAARLDRLDADERAVIERAAVVGRVFWWGAVSELSRPSVASRLSAHLQSLAAQGADPPASRRARRGRRVFSFAHHPRSGRRLPRDPEGRPGGAARAACRLARGEASERPAEYEELLGYHLEQARPLLLELGPPNERIEPSGNARRRPRLGRAARVRARGHAGRCEPPLAGARCLSEPSPIAPSFCLSSRSPAGRWATWSEPKTCRGDDGRRTRSGDAGLQAYALVIGLSMGMWTIRRMDRGGERRRRRGAICRVRGGGRPARSGQRLVAAGAGAPEQRSFRSAEVAWREAAAHAHRRR